MTAFTSFLRNSAHAIADNAQQQKVKRAISTYDAKVAGTKSEQFRDWQHARREAASVKDVALAQLPELLEQFEARFVANGGVVLWADDSAQACEHISNVVQRHSARTVVKSKSMVTEEIGIRDRLCDDGIDVWESDLGEFIVQLANETPFHIVTPAMHKSIADVAALFHRHLGTPVTDDPIALTMAARAFLRKKYIEAEIGLTGANFIISSHGAISVTENEGNGLLTMSCPPVHIVVVGIEKVIPRLSDLALFLPLLATSGSGQRLTCYNSIVSGPRKISEKDGPKEMIVILLDNGRSRLYRDPATREAMRCIRCGACLNSCPVFKNVGGHAYGVTYQGPIGSVITPHMRGFEEWSHLSQASSLCGACTASCPVSIDLHGLLLSNRRAAAKGQHWTNMDKRKILLNSWAFFCSDRSRLRLFRRCWQCFEPFFRPALSRTRLKNTPSIARESFSQWWEKNGTP